MKIIGTAILLLILYTLVTRFTYFDTKEVTGTVAAYPCAHQASDDQESCAALSQIKASYHQEIEPIFEQKCLMCHGVAKRLPLYAKLPPASWLVDYDRKEAKEEINFTWGFPFRGELGEEGQAKALEEIAEVVKENSMPPLIYLLMHWKSSLTDEEKTKILAWVKASELLLKKDSQ